MCYFFVFMGGEFFRWLVFLFWVLLVRGIGVFLRIVFLYLSGVSGWFDFE